MATTAFRRPVVALITAHVSRIMIFSDEDAIFRQMLSLPVPGLLVSCSFSMYEDALCWLTDPLPAHVVQAAAPSELLACAAPTPIDGGWLAIASKG